jgi:hypothetical protein
VKVTLLPKHTGFEEATIEILAGTLAFTVIVTALDVAGLPVAQVAFEVSMHVTMSPFTIPELVYVAELLPTPEPLSSH